MLALIHSKVRNVLSRRGTHPPGNIASNMDTDISVQHRGARGNAEGVWEGKERDEGGQDKLQLLQVRSPMETTGAYVR